MYLWKFYFGLIGNKEFINLAITQLNKSRLQSTKNYILFGNSIEWTDWLHLYTIHAFIYNDFINLIHIGVMFDTPLDKELSPWEDLYQVCVLQSYYLVNIFYFLIMYVSVTQ